MVKEQAVRDLILELFLSTILSDLILELSRFTISFDLDQGLYLLHSRQARVDS